VSEGLPPPDPRLRCCVVVPAHDEEALVGDAIEALARQRAVEPAAYEVVLVLDGCRDATGRRARERAERHPRLALHLLAGPGSGAGAARRIGMDRASERLHAVGRPAGLIACTDADSRVAPDWIAAQLGAVAHGACAIGGRIELDPRDVERLGEAVVHRRLLDAQRRHARVRAQPGPPGSTAEHWQFSGASMAVTAATYRAVGGLEPLVALEDEAFERALIDHGVPVQRPLAVRVRTSGRLRGRARLGLAHDLAALVEATARA
jgi:glycosyltransferase involved in cell wall biosynthesis